MDDFRFTHEISEVGVGFLDTNVSLENNIITDIYCKPLTHTTTFNIIQHILRLAKMEYLIASS